MSLSQTHLKADSEGSRPGTFYVNSHAPSKLPLSQLEATAFHEAVPGHHLQLGIAGELPDVPDFMRYGYQTAFGEGWGLYAERLADDMDLYSTDVDRLGMLALDSFRAARLVVDTGIHAFCWSRQRAIGWMRESTPLDEAMVAGEVDRYIAMPGQALAYRVGQRDSSHSETRPADASDVASTSESFMTLVLGFGMLPLAVLRDAVESWATASAERTLRSSY